jgi:hypothetical protein
MMASHATPVCRLQTAEMVDALSTAPPAAKLESSGRRVHAPVGTGARHRAGENWIAVPFLEPSGHSGEMPLSARTKDKGASGFVAKRAPGRTRSERESRSPGGRQTLCQRGCSFVDPVARQASPDTSASTRPIAESVQAPDARICRGAGSGTEPGQAPALADGDSRRVRASTDRGARISSIRAVL